MARYLVANALKATSRARWASTVASSQSVAPSSSSVSLPSLSNIEASWKGLTAPEQEAVFKHLEELQKKDWKELSIDQKKAAYYVAFGPHGPREPHLQPGSSLKIAAGTLAAIGVAIAVFAAIRSRGSTPPTMSQEWQDATKERLIEQGANPFTGVSAKARKEQH